MDNDQYKFQKGKAERMKIVVCDDSKEDLKEIDGLLIKYKTEHADAEFEVECFTDSDLLYRRILAGKPGDVYILDMIMSEKTGIDIGSLIRSTDEKSVIIYITASDDFALEAYGVHAVRYLLKPVKKEQFYEAVDFAFNSIPKKKPENSYQVKTKEGQVAVPFSQIEYIENYSRVINVCMTDGKNIKSIYIRKSFNEETKPVLEDNRFIQVHKSFIINMDYVDRLAQGSITMESGKNIPVSRARTAEVKKAYLMFVSRRYGQGGGKNGL